MLTGWSSTVYILLVNIFNHTFNLFINNIGRKPIIDESLFYVFYLFIKYCFGGGDQFGAGYQVINNSFFYIWRGFTFKFECTGVIIRGFFLYVEVVKLLLLLVSMRTSKKEILLFLFSSWVKLTTEFFWKVTCSPLISLILFARIRISSTYLRYTGGFFML